MPRRINHASGGARGLRICLALTLVLTASSCGGNEWDDLGAWSLAPEGPEGPTVPAGDGHDCGDLSAAQLLYTGAVEGDPAGAPVSMFLE